MDNLFIEKIINDVINKTIDKIIFKDLTYNLKKFINHKKKIKKKWLDFCDEKKFGKRENTFPNYFKKYISQLNKCDKYLEITEMIEYCNNERFRDKNERFRRPEREIKSITNTKLHYLFEVITIDNLKYIK